MKHQKLSQTKNAIAASNRESAIARYSPHPIEELQSAIAYAIRSSAPANRTLKMGMCDRLVSPKCNRILSTVIHLFLCSYLLINH